jgi:separase
MLGFNSSLPQLGCLSFCLTFLGFCSGQLYCKRQLWDEAESELNYARDLVENDATISCKLCSLTLGISVDMQVGDLSWSLFGKKNPETDDS